MFGVRLRASHTLLDAGGVTENSRWSSEATTTGSPSKMKCAPDGARENVRTKNAHARFPPPHPGRMFFPIVIRWCSLAALARPPANFRCPSGTHPTVLPEMLATGFDSKFRVPSSELRVQPRAAAPPCQDAHSDLQRACGGLNLELGTWNLELGMRTWRALSSHPHPCATTRSTRSSSPKTARLAKQSDKRSDHLNRFRAVLPIDAKIFVQCENADDRHEFSHPHQTRVSQ